MIAQGKDSLTIAPPITTNSKSCICCLHSFEVINGAL